MSELSNNERSPYTHVIKLDAEDLVAIGNGGQKTIANIPVGGAVELCCVINTVDIVGSTTLVLDIGTTGADPDEFIDALDVDAMTVGLPTFNTGDLMLQSAGTTVTLAGVTPAKPVSAVTPIILEVTDAAVASITAGEVVVGLRILDLAKFA